MNKLSHGPGLYNNGLKPIYKITPDSDEWQFIPEKSYFEKTEEWSTLRFNFKFDCSSSSIVHFAFSFPFGYEDACNQADELETKLKDHEEIYFFRELIAYSLEKRRVELLTITDHSNKTDTTEPFI